MSSCQTRRHVFLFRKTHTKHCGAECPHRKQQTKQAYKYAFTFGGSFTMHIFNKTNTHTHTSKHKTVNNNDPPDPTLIWPRGLRIYHKLPNELARRPSCTGTQKVLYRGWAYINGQGHIHQHHDTHDGDGDCQARVETSANILLTTPVNTWQNLDGPQKV